jgi:hypothetical protein
MNETEFKKRPIKVVAMQYDGTEKSFEALSTFTDYLIEEIEDGQLQIPTLEGPMRVNQSDWIIKGIKNEFYPCREDIFNETYEQITEKSLFDYKIGETNPNDMFNGCMKAPNKLVKVSFTFQDKNGTQMETVLKDPDYKENFDDD